MNGPQPESGELTIRAVEPASCLDHVDVVLRGAAGAELRVRVDAHLGRGIHAELHGLASEPAVFVDLLKAVLSTHGSSFSHVLVAEGAPASGAVVFIGAADATGIRGLPQGVPLLIAARLRLPVRVIAAPQQPAAGDLPEPFRRFLEELPLDGLEHGSPRSRGDA